MCLSVGEAKGKCFFKNAQNLNRFSHYAVEVSVIFFQCNVWLTLYNYSVIFRGSGDQLENQDKEDLLVAQYVDFSILDSDYIFINNNNSNTAFPILMKSPSHS